MQKIRFPTHHQLVALKSGGSLVIIMKTSAIVIAIVALYYQDLNLIFNDALQNEVTSHILAIPFLFSYLLYRKRKMLEAAISFETTHQPKNTKTLATLSGILLCTTATILYWHGSYTFTPLEYHMGSLFLFVTGLILIIFDTKTLKVLAFPIAFLLLLTPPPLQVVSQVGGILSTISSEAAYNVLKALGLPVTLANQYETPLIILNKPESPPFTFAIEISCSGIYSFIGFTIFAVFVTYIARGATWKKITVFLAGFPLFYALNILRIIIIVLIGYEYGAQAAIQAFHLLGGWVLIFLGTLLLLFISEKTSKIQIFRKNKATPCPNCNPNTKNKEFFCLACGRLLKRVNINISKRDLAKIAALLISTVLIQAIQVPTFALAEGPAQVLVQSPGGEYAATTQIFPQIPDYNLQFVYRDKRFEELAPRDAALVYAYTTILNESGKTIWVALEVGSSRLVWHSWEASVIIWPQKLGRPPRAIQLDLRDVQLLENPPIIGRFFAFQRVNSSMTQVVLYWYESALFKTSTTSELKYVKISLITYTNNPEDIYQIEEKLLPFGLAIANYWQPIKTWSQIALILCRNGDTLIAITIALLFSVFLLQALQRRRERKANNNVYEKLSKVNRKIVDAVHQTETTVTPTLDNITLIYQNMTGKTINKETLRQKLIEAEKSGTIKSDIVSRQDEPIQVWKTETMFKRTNLPLRISNWSKNEL